MNQMTTNKTFFTGIALLLLFSLSGLAQNKADFEGEIYRVLRYSGGTLSKAAVLVDAYGEYFINGVECNEAQFLEKLNEYGIADADNVSFMIGKGKMEWEAPFEKEIPEKSSDIDRILDQKW